MAAEFGFKPAEAFISGNDDTVLPIDGESTIFVSCRGGGDFMDGTATSWTLASLKAAAMKFPGKAMVNPARTQQVFLLPSLGF